MYQTPISFKKARNFSISGCNFGEVQGAFVVNPSESLTTRSRRRSKTKSQKTHSRSVRSSPTATSGLGVDSQFTDSGHDADVSEPGSEHSHPGTLNPFGCSTRRPEMPMYLRNSVPHPSHPSSIYPYGSPSDDDRRRRLEHLSTIPLQPFPPLSPRLPSISTHPQYSPSPVRPARARCINCDIDSGRRASELNANSVRAARAHSMPHRSASPPNLAGQSQYKLDALRRHGQRPPRRHSCV